MIKILPFVNYKIQVLNNAQSFYFVRLDLSIYSKHLPGKIVWFCAFRFWNYYYLGTTAVHNIRVSPALCAGLIPIPSLVIIALVAAGTLNWKDKKPIANYAMC